MDTWINGYTRPNIDPVQNLRNTTGKIVNGTFIFEFVRARSTNDEKDLAFTNDRCLFMMFPIKGGTVHPVNKFLGKHETTPFVTDRRICIKSCGRESNDFVEVTTPTPNRLVYAIAVKLKNLAENFDAPARGTPEFEVLSNTISDSFQGVLNNIPGYYKIDVTGFEK